MREGDNKQQHDKKVARKRRELHAKGWSEARINCYMRDWSTFDVKTYRKARHYGW